MLTQRVRSTQRKYTPLWNKLKEKGEVAVKCSRQDTMTIITGLAKEKVQDKKKDPQKILRNELTEEGIIFRLVLDTSVNNL